MSIVSRLFGKKVKNRNDRIKVQQFHKIQLLIEENQYPVENVSVTGLGFIDKDGNKEFKKNKIIHAVVKVLDQLCDIQIDIRHNQNGLIGCKVITSCEIYRKYVEDYFRSELEGLKLRLISSDSIQENEYGEPFWLYGDYNHEIYYTVKKDKITSFQINFHGQIVSFSDGKVSTGVVWEDEREDVAHKSSDLIKESSKLPKEMMEFIFRFVEVAVDIKKSYKDEILALIDKRFKQDWKK
jgi:hypothetical protein